MKYAIWPTTLLVILAGCGPTIQIEERYHQSPPLKVAVLPFSGPATDRDTLDEVAFVRRKFCDQFSRLPMVHLQPARIDRELFAQGIRSREELHQRSAAELGRLLDVDALIYGEIDSIRNVAPILGYYRGLSGRIRMVEASEAESPFLEIEHTERMAGGVLLSSDQVLTGVMEQIENSSNLALVQLVERWCSSVIEQIPSPERADRSALEKALLPPKITSARGRPGRTGPLIAGDRIVFTCQANPQLDVEADLGHLGRLTLAETTPGRYQCTWIVPAGSGARLTRWTLRATNRHGQTSPLVVRSSIILAARPPDPVTNLTVEASTSGPHLSWTPSKTDRNHSLNYEIFRTPSEQPGAWVRVGTSNTPSYTDRNAPPNSPHLYQVLATGAAGRSHPTAPVEFSP